MILSDQLYAENSSLLRGLCYRMTGNAADAEEIVQETFLKVLLKPPKNSDGPLRPWLIRVAVNLSRDLLRRRRRTQYVGPWLPSPIPTDDQGFEIDIERTAETDASPAARYDMLESVSTAFLLALEALTPTQRAVLLLRDVFDYSTGETADVLQMTESNVKVTLHRARRIMREYDTFRKDARASKTDGRRVLERFLRCLAEGDAEGLENLLSEDVIVISDGGGEVNALLEPMHGREKVIRLVTRLYNAYRAVTKTSMRELNGAFAILVTRSSVPSGHATRYTLQCELDSAGRIGRMNFVFAPSKLRAVKDQL